MCTMDPCFIITFTLLDACALHPCAGAVLI